MPEMNFQLTSPAFENEATIPAKYTCQGEDVSPELSWGEPPAHTRSFTLIVDDPDAPGRTFTHWVLADIPGTARGLAEGASDVGVAAVNDFGSAGYGGPCPPPGHGKHRYFFKLYALDRESLGLSKGASRADVERAMDGHVLSQIQLMGTYERSG